MFIRKIFKYAGLLSLAVMIVLVSGCFFSAPMGKLVTPAIRAIGLPDASVVGSVSLKVTGPDMDPVEVSYSTLPSVINISIPEGTDRTFELTVGLSPAFTALPTTTYTSLKGKAIANVTSDSAVITLTMGIGSTKIIVPDYWNSRILQFDDISGTNEVKLSSVDNPVFAGWLTVKTINFLPYDIDFDSQGRIYIANYDPSEGIIRVDNIEGINPHAFGVGSQINALTVDRVNNLVYYTNGTNVWKNNLDGTNEQPLSAISGEGISGLAVADGVLYMAVSGGAVSSYDLSKGISADFIDTGGILNTPWDVMVKDDKLYVANLGGANGYQILELSTSDLSLTGHYGDQASGTDTTKGQFYGLRRFVAILNKKLTIVDDSNSLNLDKLVSMDDITGSGWQTLPGSGDGQGLFQFYYSC